MSSTFEYLRPESIDQAVEMKAKHGDQARYWAGGTDMVLLWQRRAVNFNYCIDLTYIPELRFVELDGDSLRIGAMATLDDIDLSSSLNSVTQTLGYTVRLMCTKQTRTIATVGGNMCHASPSADLTPPLVAMGAMVNIQGSGGSRVVSLADFHLGVNKTVLEADEVVTEFVIPDSSKNVATSYKRVARTVVDIALVSSAVCLRSEDDGTIYDAGIALGAVAPTAIRAREAEKILVGSTLKEAANGLAAKAGKSASLAAKAISDIRASQEYRTEMISVLTERAIQQCIQSLEGSK